MGYKGLDKHNHWMVGPGFKIEVVNRERLTLGFGYEYQFFTNRKAPTGMSSILVTMGKMF